jgi:hypothetical protein
MILASFPCLAPDTRSRADVDEKESPQKAERELNNKVAEM